MPSLYEYYNTNDDGMFNIYGASWAAQTFTVGAAGHTITSVKLKLFRVGNPQTVTASIKKTNAAGHPTGADLTLGTIDGNSLTTDTAGLWYEISLTEYTLDPNTKYAICLRAPDGSWLNRVSWRVDSTAATYEGGNYEFNNESGKEGAWYANYTQDMMFEVWGNPLAKPLMDGFVLVS